MISDDVQQKLEEISKDTYDADRQLAIQRNKLMKPIYTKRREILKQVPNFWGTAMGNHQMISVLFEDIDQELLNNITDFHIEHDEQNPDSYTVSATFSKNNSFENESLTKKITVTEDGDAADVQKSTIKWKSGKGPDSKKRKAGDEDFETTSFIEWFGDDDHILGSLFRDDFFPDAIRYYNGEEEDDDEDDEDLEDIELGSEDEDDEEEEEEEEQPKSKKARK